MTMHFQPPLKERIIAGAGYALPLFLAGPLLSIDAVLTIGAVLVYYFIFRTTSRYVFHHVRQNVNLVFSYYIYRGAVNFFVFILERGLRLGGAGLQDWLSEQMFLQPLLFLGGILSPIFFLLLLQTVFYITLVVLLLLVFFGKWTRIPLLVRFIKNEMHELPPKRSTKTH
ncbi:hypothetical protein [Salibacterium aidingense]|uniref:hypothetical protein n=1 Tax=Salibacterium aidingense TaxID=384933 RepID=UPI003BEB122A